MDQQDQVEVLATKPDDPRDERDSQMSSDHMGVMARPHLHTHHSHTLTLYTFPK